MQRAGSPQPPAELYVNGVKFCDIPQNGNLPQGSTTLSFPSNDVAYKDLKIWIDEMPATFLK